eukprot:6129014-Prymnesium_polylepis.2
MHAATPRTINAYTQKRFDRTGACDSADQTSRHAQRTPCSRCVRLNWHDIGGGGGGAGEGEGARGGGGGGHEGGNDGGGDGAVGEGRGDDGEGGGGRGGGEGG